MESRMESTMNNLGIYKGSYTNLHESTMNC